MRNIISQQAKENVKIQSAVNSYIREHYFDDWNLTYTNIKPSLNKDEALVSTILKDAGSETISRHIGYVIDTRNFEIIEVKELENTTN